MKATSASKCPQCGLLILKTDKGCSRCAKEALRQRSVEKERKRNTLGLPLKGIGGGTAGVVLLLYLLSRIPILMRISEEHRQRQQNLPSPAEQSEKMHRELRESMQRQSEAEGKSLEEYVAGEVMKLSPRANSNGPAPLPSREDAD